MEDEIEEEVEWVLIDLSSQDLRSLSRNSFWSLESLICLIVSRSISWSLVSILMYLEGLSDSEESGSDIDEVAILSIWRGLSSSDMFGELDSEDSSKRAEIF